jgi:hypothetical protein
MGRLIPAGTGLEFYRNVELISEEGEQGLVEEAPPELELTEEIASEEQPQQERATT